MTDEEQKTKEKKKVDWRIVCTAIACLAGIEIVALLKGIDGTLLSVMIGVIAALAGLVTPSPVQTK